MDNRERLDQLGRQWMQCRATGTQAERKNLETEIFLLILQLFPKQTDAVGTLYEKDWEKFDAQEGSLYDFCRFRLPKRMDAVEQKDMDGRYVRKEDEVSGKQVKYKERHASLYKKVGEEGEGKLIEVVRRKEEGGADTGVMLNSTMVELITLMLRLPQELRGRANNPQRLNYFRMFFTDSVADIAQNQEGISSLEERERDLFQVPYRGTAAGQPKQTLWAAGFGPSHDRPGTSPAQRCLLRLFRSAEGYQNKGFRAEQPANRL